MKRALKSLRKNQLPAQMAAAARMLTVTSIHEPTEVTETHEDSVYDQNKAKTFIITDADEESKHDLSVHSDDTMTPYDKMKAISAVRGPKKRTQLIPHKPAFPLYKCVIICLMLIPTCIAIQDFEGDHAKIFAWNVNGIRAAIKKGSLNDFIKDFRPEVLSVSELKIDKETFDKVEADNETSLSKQLPKEYYQYWNCCGPQKRGYSGTAVFTKGKAGL